MVGNKNSINDNSNNKLKNNNFFYNKNNIRYFLKSVIESVTIHQQPAK